MVKEEKKLNQNFYPKNYSLLIVWGLWRVHCQFFYSLSEGIHNNKCKYGIDKKCEKCGIKCKNNGNVIIILNMEVLRRFKSIKLFCHDRNYQKGFDED